MGILDKQPCWPATTQAIANYLKQIMISKYNLTKDNLHEHLPIPEIHFCYATNDNQTAVSEMETNADLAIVVGGYNSSNTSHLVELCEEALPTYFINGFEKLINDKEILHYNFHTKKKF